MDDIKNAVKKVKQRVATTTKEITDMTKSVLTFFQRVIAFVLFIQKSAVFYYTNFWFFFALSVIYLVPFLRFKYRFIVSLMIALALYLKHKFVNS